MEEGGAKPVCAEEALQLLNCVTQSPFDEDKCLRLLHSLRQCVLAKENELYSFRMYRILTSFKELLNLGNEQEIKVKNFSLAGQEQQETKPSSKKD